MLLLFQRTILCSDSFLYGILTWSDTVITYTSEIGFYASLLNEFTICVLFIAEDTVVRWNRRRVRLHKVLQELGRLRPFFLNWFWFDPRNFFVICPRTYALFTYSFISLMMFAAVIVSPIEPFLFWCEWSWWLYKLNSKSFQPILLHLFCRMHHVINRFETSGFVRVIARWT